MATKTNLTSDSRTIGNYYNSEITLNRGRFAQTNDLLNWFDYNSDEKADLVTGNKKKTQSSYFNGILLTTGASEQTKLQNIYDIAGNIYEWTLESANITSTPCIRRGGSYYSNGSNESAKCRIYNATNISNIDIGFRIGLWK